MDQDREKIRDRAYEIWDREGRQEGRDDEYWLRAERELSASRDGGAGRPAEAASTSAESPTAGITDATSAPAKTNKKANGATKPLAAKAPAQRKRRGSQPLSQA
jgi:hypothetical protein